MRTDISLRFLIALTAIFLSSCASLPDDLVKTPQVSLSGVEVVGLGFKNQTFLLSFEVVNPNPYSLPIRSIQYGVKLDGQRFASGETPCEFAVPANGDTTFAISVELSLLQTAPQLLTVLRDGARGSIEYELRGQFAVDIPLTPAIKYQNSGAISLNSGSL